MHERFYTYTSSVLHLPLYLEKRLNQLFPKVTDKNNFVKEVLINALDEMQAQEQEMVQHNDAVLVGGSLHVYTDGGSRGNPGQAAIGCVIKDATSGTVLQEYKEAIGIETNNIAEYKALIKGLEIVRGFNPNSVVCHLDSELVVKQVTGAYRVKMPHLQPLLVAVQAQAAHLRAVQFMYIPRLQNRAADALVNQALDALKKS